MQVHRVLMLASLFIGVVGVVLVFVGHAREDHPRGLIELGSANVSNCNNIDGKLVLECSIFIYNRHQAY